MSDTIKKKSSTISRSINRLEASNSSNQFRNSLSSSSHQMLNMMNTSSSTTSLTNFELDFDTLLSKENGRKLFSKFLKEFNKSLDNLLTVYLIMSCFQNKNYIEQDSERIKQILERTYNACFVKNELTHLSLELKAKLGESLQNKIYDESIFNAVKKELRNLLENEYFPMFLESRIFKENLSKKMIFNTRNADTVSLNEEYATISDIYAQEASDVNVGHEHSNGIAIKDQSYSVANLDDADKRLINNQKSHAKTSSGSLFAMPNIPSLKPSQKQTQHQQTSNRMLKQSKSSSSSTSSVASTTSAAKRPTSANRNKEPMSSVVKLLLSNELPVQHRFSNMQMPPNPYHIATKAIPVSAQDSEIQSTVSADFTSEDHVIRFSKNLNEMSSLSCSKNSLHQSRLPRLNRDIKASLIANKNVEINMPEFLQETSVQPLKKPAELDKQKPLSEADPLSFFNLLSSKLESLMIKNEYEEIDPPCIINNARNNSEAPEFSFRDKLEKLSIPIESDLDSHIDEHINRVYNNNTTHNENNRSQFSNPIMNNSGFCETQNLSNVNSKMFKVSSLHDQTSNKSLNLNGFHQESISSFYHNTSVSALPIHNNLSSTHKATKLNSSLSASQTRSLKFNKNKDIEDSNQHHFYKLTSTSKEVDIDHHTHQIEEKKNNHSIADMSLQMKKSNSKHDVNKSALYGYKLNKPTKSNNTNDMNYDSGVSIRSAASIERVNDWLTNSGYQSSANNNNNNNNHHRENNQKNSKKANDKIKNIINKEIPLDNSFKTTVAYYLPGEDVAYISTFNGKNLTLSQFKQFITKKGQFRFFFKTKSDLLDDEECIVFQEATDENAFVPMFNSKVIAKIEKINDN